MGSPNNPPSRSSFGDSWVIYLLRLIMEEFPVGWNGGGLAAEALGSGRTPTPKLGLLGGMRQRIRMAVPI